MSKMTFSLLLLLSLGAPAVRGDDTPDLARLKKNTQIFERIVQTIVRQNFPHPLALRGEPQGAYLDGHGVVVSFHLNINRARIRTPFGEVPARGGDKRPKAEQLRILKNSLLHCLADHGQTFKQLKPEEKISIDAHIEDRNEVDVNRKMTVMVLSVSRRDVALVSTRKISFDEFARRVEVLQY